MAEEKLVFVMVHMYAKIPNVLSYLPVMKASLTGSTGKPREERRKRFAKSVITLHLKKAVVQEKWWSIYLLKNWYMYITLGSTNAT